MPESVSPKGTKRIAASIDFPDDYDLGAEQKTDEADVRARAREVTRRHTGDQPPTARSDRTTSAASWTSVHGDNETIKIDPNWTPPSDEPRQPPSTRRVAAHAEVHADDAETLRRIAERKQARAEESSNAMRRRREKEAQEQLELQAILPKLRERQQQEIQRAIQLQLEQEEREGRKRWQTVADAMQEVANVYLALGICPDHVEWLPQKGAYRTWKGTLYTPADLAALLDAEGKPLYQFEVRADGQPAQAYSPRERAWGLHQPVSPDRAPFTIDRVLPIPMLFDGEVRFSAHVPNTIRMSEGLVTVYVLGRLVYFAGQLGAAQRAWRQTQGFDHKLAAGLDKVGALVSGTGDLMKGAVSQVGDQVKGGSIVETAGSVADAMSAGVDKVVSVAKAITTRLIRRK